MLKTGTYVPVRHNVVQYVQLQRYTFENKKCRQYLLNRITYFGKEGIMEGT